jgi:hypothetical protein
LTQATGLIMNDYEICKSIERYCFNVNVGAILIQATGLIMNDYEICKLIENIALM